MKKKLLALTMAMTMLCGSAMTVCAETQTVTTDGTLNATVSTKSGEGGSEQSSFVVRVPSGITLSRDASEPTKFTGTYTVAAKGVLASGKYVTITPASSFAMTGASTKASATASVTQETTKWLDADATVSTGSVKIGTTSYTGAEAEGSIAVTITKADSYSGTLGFTVKLN